MSQTILQEREQEYRLKAQRDLQQDYSLHGLNQPSTQWQQQIANAKIAWGKLTEHELVNSEGEVQQLVSLVKDCYAISHIEAEKQVNAFLQKKYS